MTRRRRAKPDDAPTSLADALSEVGAELGLPEPGLVGVLTEHWPDVVGTAIAGHAHPRDLRDGTLTIAVDAPPWATELRYLEADICARFRAITGRDVIERVRVVVERPR
jgi:predicted nucleic acid-binding Zn ribbon protein